VRPLKEKNQNMWGWIETRKITCMANPAPLITDARTKTGNGNAAAWRVYAITCMEDPEWTSVVSAGKDPETKIT
jgi:hypothetical protein